MSCLFWLLKTQPRSSVSTVGAHVLLIPKVSLSMEAILNPNIAELKCILCDVLASGHLARSSKLRFPGIMQEIMSMQSLSGI